MVLGMKLNTLFICNQEEEKLLGCHVFALGGLIMVALAFVYLHCGNGHCGAFKDWKIKASAFRNEFVYQG
jgi:hypothetical protein